MAKPRSARTEVLSAKITNPMMKRLDKAVDRLGLNSRNEAVNQALEFWLISHEGPPGPPGPNMEKPDDPC